MKLSRRSRKCVCVIVRDYEMGRGTILGMAHTELQTAINNR